jgi:L-2,4-diaminobutyrate decarboxylase
MMGHMDTAPHPAAAFTDALVSALNNNLLFRELSPLASRVEERLVGDIGARLGLSASWTGTLASGGSIANLTALFAAVGGFADVESRSQCDFFFPECAHVSLKKSAAVLGISGGRLHMIPGDALGRADISALRAALGASKAWRKVVVGVLGSTVYGAVENVEAGGGEHDA